MHNLSEDQANCGILATFKIIPKTSYLTKTIIFWNDRTSKNTLRKTYVYKVLKLLPHSLAHLFTLLLPRSLTQSLPQSLARSLAHLLARSLTHSLARLARLLAHCLTTVARLEAKKHHTAMHKEFFELFAQPNLGCILLIWYHTILLNLL